MSCFTSYYGFFIDFQRLLTRVIREEVSSLPRGLAYNITRRNQPNFRHLDSVPSSLLSQYEKSKTPGVNQGLAGQVNMDYGIKKLAIL